MRSVSYAVLAVVLLAFAVNAEVITVTPGNMGDWVFLNSSPDGVGEMVAGPATPPLGVGSAQLNTGTHGDERVELRNSGWAGTPLSALVALSYSTYVTENNGQQFPYLFVDVNVSGGTGVDDVLAFEPPYQTPSSGNPSLPNQGNPALNTWQTWNALPGGWWSDWGVVSDMTPGTGVQPLSHYLETYPNAKIVNADGGLGGVRLIFGWASPEDRFNGYVDNFTIGTAAKTLTYDFDPNPAVPEPATVALLGAGLAAILVRRRYFGRSISKRSVVRV